MSALSIIDGPDRARFQALVEDCLAGPNVGVMECIATTPEGSELRIEIILAPLRSDFDQMNRLLGAVHALDIADGEVFTAPRRCRIAAARTFDFHGLAGFKVDSPLPGFAEEAEPFDFERPELQTIEGGAQRGERRRGHLKLVKD